MCPLLLDGDISDGQKKCIPLTETFQVVCTCRPQLETALSALNNLHGVKASRNIEKEQDIF